MGEWAIGITIGDYIELRFSVLGLLGFGGSILGSGLVGNGGIGL